MDDTYIYLRRAVAWALKRSKAYIIGGDFNTTLSWGPRMETLLSFSCDFNLHIANEQEDDSMNDKWTFESSSGVRRQLDFILVGPGFDTFTLHASSELDLGSDHRSVVAMLTAKAGFPRDKNIKTKGALGPWKGRDGYPQQVNKMIA